MPSRSSFLSDLSTVLRGADFRKVFAVRLVSQASDGAFQVGLASLVFFSPERATTAREAAIAAAITVLPYTLIGPFAGVMLDVWQRRQVLLVANAVRAVMVVGVAMLVLAGQVGAPLYLAALACLSVNRFFLAGLGASLPHVVPRHELVMANAVSPTCGTVAALLGAGAGFLVHRVLGSGAVTDATVLAGAAVGYAASALLARRMRRTLLGPDVVAPLDLRSLQGAARDIVRDLADGARHVSGRRRAGDALMVIGVHRIGFGIMTIALILLCRNHFTDPSDTQAGLALLAQAVAASGLGVAAAALLTPAGVARTGPARWIVVCLVGAAVVQAVVASALSAVVLVCSAFLLGLAGQGVKICVDSLVQSSVDDGYRGRVFAFYDVVFNVAFVTAAGLSVLVLPADGDAPGVFGAVAAGYALLAACYATVRRRDALGRRGRPTPSGTPGSPSLPGAHEVGVP